MNILQIIARLQAERKQKGIFPENVPEVDLLKAIHDGAKQEINKLVLDGKIVFHNTLNSRSYSIKE